MEYINKESIGLYNCCLNYDKEIIKYKRLLLG